MLAVNDRCDDEAQRFAMRSSILSSAEAAFNEVKRAFQRDVPGQGLSGNGE